MRLNTIALFLFALVIAVTLIPNAGHVIVGVITYLTGSPENSNLILLVGVILLLCVAIILVFRPD